MHGYFVGVEKNNDSAKHCYYSSNKHDPCGEVIRTERRQEALDTAGERRGPTQKQMRSTGPLASGNRGRSDQETDLNFFFNGFSQSHPTYKGYYLLPSY